MTKNIARVTLPLLFLPFFLIAQTESSSRVVEMFWYDDLPSRVAYHGLSECPEPTPALTSNSYALASAVFGTDKYGQLGMGREGISSEWYDETQRAFEERKLVFRLVPNDKPLPRQAFSDQTSDVHYENSSQRVANDIPEDVVAELTPGDIEGAYDAVFEIYRRDETEISERIYFLVGPFSSGIKCGTKFTMYRIIKNGEPWRTWFSLPTVYDSK